MATALPPVEARDVVRCDFCSLVQFAPSDLAAPCRRCHIRLAWVEVPETTPPAPAPEPERTVTLAQTLRELRLRAGLSQRELARKMGVPRTYCSKVENEKATPTLPSLARVARALGFSLFGLLQLCERRKDESHSALLQDPFVTLLVPYVSSLSELQRRTLLARIASMAQGANRAA